MNRKHKLTSVVAFPALSFSIFLLGFVLLTSHSDDASAQALNMKGSKGGDPITVDAEEGIEWRQNEFVFIARGSARAVRGKMTINGDELRAYYREGSEAGTDIWRLDSLGNVKLSQPGQIATGDNAVYDVDRGILVLKPLPGERARFVSGVEEVSSTGQIEFWETRGIAVARGQAQAVQVVRDGRNTGKNRRLFADVLVAHLAKDAKGETAVQRIEAYDQVRIVTDEDTVTASRGTFEVESGLATLVGAVRMVRAGSTLEGCRAVVDTKAGVSRLFACPPQGGSAGDNAGGSRVRGQLVPKGTPAPKGAE